MVKLSEILSGAMSWVQVKALAQFLETESEKLEGLQTRESCLKGISYIAA